MRIDIAPAKAVTDTHTDAHYDYCVNANSLCTQQSDAIQPSLPSPRTVSCPWWWCPLLSPCGGHREHCHTAWPGPAVLGWPSCHCPPADQSRQGSHLATGCCCGGGRGGEGRGGGGGTFNEQKKKRSKVHLHSIIIIMTVCA